MKICMSKNKEEARQFVEEIYIDLKTVRAGENSIRKQYLTLLETMHAHLLNSTSRSKLSMTEKSPMRLS